MKETLYFAQQELKRAEHLLYVSLKYTRTGDVIKSLVSRLIACIDFANKAILVSREAELIEIPDKPFPQVNLIKQLYPENTKLIEYLDFYLLLRQISRTSSHASGEFRRNLTLHVPLDREIQITIDISQDYYKRTEEFFSFVCAMLIHSKE